MQETWVQILSLEDPLEEEIATSPVFLPGKTPWTKKKKNPPSHITGQIGVFVFLLSNIYEESDTTNQLSLSYQGQHPRSLYQFSSVAQSCLTLRP